MVDIIVNIGIPLTYVLIAVAALTSIIFPIREIIQQPKHAKGTLMGLGALLAVIILGYLLSGEGVIHGATGKVLAEGFTSKMVGAGIISFYIFIIGATLAIVYSEAMAMMKK